MAKSDNPVAWYGRLDPNERRTLWACFGGWSLNSLDFFIFTFRPSRDRRGLGHDAPAGRHDHDLDAGGLGVGGLDRGRARRPLRPCARVADHDPLVCRLWIALRLRPGLLATAHLPHADGPRPRRRMGGGRRSPRRSDPRQGSRQGRRHDAERMGHRLGDRGADFDRDPAEAPARHLLARPVVHRLVAGASHFLHPAPHSRRRRVQRDAEKTSRQAPNGEFYRIFSLPR